MDTENNAMHVNPKHKWCKKNRLVKYLKIENFPVLIDWASIEYQSSQANSNIKHILHQNQGTYNLGWPQQDHTQYNVPSLAKSNLFSVCN